MLWVSLTNPLGSTLMKHVEIVRLTFWWLLSKKSALVIYLWQISFPHRRSYPISTSHHERLGVIWIGCTSVHLRWWDICSSSMAIIVHEKYWYWGAKIDQFNSIQYTFLAFPQPLPTSLLSPLQTSVKITITHQAINITRKSTKCSDLVWILHSNPEETTDRPYQMKVVMLTSKSTGVVVEKSTKPNSLTNSSAVRQHLKAWNSLKTNNAKMVYISPYKFRVLKKWV